MEKPFPNFDKCKQLDQNTHNFSVRPQPVKWCVNNLHASYPFCTNPDVGKSMLSRQQADLIRVSAERLSGANVAATNAFYTSLFLAAPGVRSLFPDDMFEQSAKLWDTIAMVVHSADDLSEIEAELLALGARHVGYGAEPAHYVVVTDVLIKTMSTIMRDEWSCDTQRAWKAALETVCAVMIRGATDHAS